MNKNPDAVLVFTGDVNLLDCIVFMIELVLVSVDDDVELFSTVTVVVLFT